MRRSFRRLTTAVAIVVGVTLLGSAAADAESVMKMCGEQWKGSKAAGTTNRETWQQFLARCRTQQGDSASQAPAPTTDGPMPVPVGAGEFTPHGVRSSSATGRPRSSGSNMRRPNAVSRTRSGATRRWPMTGATGSNCAAR